MRMRPSPPMKLLKHLPQLCRLEVSTGREHGGIDLLVNRELLKTIITPDVREVAADGGVLQIEFAAHRVVHAGAIEVVHQRLGRLRIDLGLERRPRGNKDRRLRAFFGKRSEEHTSELQS